MTSKNVAEQVIEFYSESLPKHVGIIMDGNGRWAQERKRPRVYGHKKGVDAVRAAVRFARQVGIESLTLFAFSSENWKRPEDEVSSLMELFILVLNKEIKTLHKNNIKLKVVGDTTAFSPTIQKKIEQAEQLTNNNDGLILNIAANYGGRWDILEAGKKLANKIVSGEITEQDVNEELFDELICLSEQSPLDLMIRTGGEHRISNFLLWQAAYAELHFTSVYWPDFNEVEFAKAVEVFAGTERRFGLTGEQVSN